MSIGEFTAVAVCPRCNLVAIHRMRPPRPRPADYEPGVIKRLPNGDQLVTWGRVDHYATVEAGTVVRQCQCGHEWGQK